MVRASSCMSSMSALKIQSVGDVYYPNVSLDETYNYTLKLLILDYINEPRFNSVKVDLQGKSNVIQRRIQPNVNSNNSDINKNKIDHHVDELTEKEILDKIAIKLIDYLNKVAMKEVTVSDSNTRRSLLKFYNDIYLGSDNNVKLRTFRNFEELLISFIKVANLEIQKLQLTDQAATLHTQLDCFIKILISILPNSLSRKHKETLSYYKSLIKDQENFDRNKVIFTTTHLDNYGIRSQGSDTNLTTQNTGKVRKPTFRVKEISHSNYLMQLFDINEIKFQQDVIKVIKESDNNMYVTELGFMESKIINDRWDVKPHQFTQRTHILIPDARQDIYLTLVKLVLQKELKKGSKYLELSSDAWYFILRTANFWGLNYYSTLSSLIYTAANLSILKETEIDVDIISNLLTVIYKRILTKTEYRNISSWNAKDQQMWNLNLYHTSNQCLYSLTKLVYDLFNKHKPKFSELLGFYHKHIIDAPSFKLFCEENNLDIKNLWLKTIKRAIFKVNENYYVFLLKKLPKNNDITTKHLKCLVIEILDEIAILRRKYPILLLDSIMIGNECLSCLTKLLSSDILMLWKHIQTVGSNIPPVTSLETYTTLSELRKIYTEVHSQAVFPFNIENIFINDLFSLADDISRNINNSVTNIIKTEKWDMLNEQVKHSIAVIDIFKMFNESISIFFNLGWNNNSHLNLIITFILKTFSNSLSLYATTVFRMVNYDLTNDNTIQEYQFQQDILKEVNTLHSTDISKDTAWNFTAMKNSLLFRKQKFPKPYEFSKRACIILNNTSKMLSMVDTVEDTISKINIAKVSNYNTYSNVFKVNLNTIYTVKIVSANNLPEITNNSLNGTYVSIIDSTNKIEIAKTHLVCGKSNPNWNQEFQFEKPFNEDINLSVILWNKVNGLMKKHENYETCGKASLSFDDNNFKRNGLPNHVVLQLDTQGEINLQVSIEEEQFDSFFYIGKIYRTLETSQEKIIQKIVQKFKEFICCTFSRNSLKILHGNSGSHKASKEQINDVLVPFFDYLNANLAILAMWLAEYLLHEVMLKVWDEVLNVAYELLLPPLSIADTKREYSKISSWDDSLKETLFNKNFIKGYGRQLTQIETETVFTWLNILCMEFFYNNGEGPSLVELKSEKYREILIIPLFYDKSDFELMEEIEILSSSFVKYLNKCISHNNSTNNFNLKATLISRQKTIIGCSSKSKRNYIREALIKQNEDILEKSVVKMDLILRILLSRKHFKFVREHLNWRREMKNKLLIERRVNEAVNWNFLNNKISKKSSIK
ncbi:hypothetical protein TPHA_0J01590 [Tetrapisispora phaffii CBS 4417]|uniref:C2 domain-containing protein n=1 Tax=Tetrapisispora phaffii (strain ATCC 24235 / CBS 4417 / NBRC 1672 / NRRL Y-8282 / UCD 70-5) TaxID=1071381 RepID=G8BYN8_TETPH|nr:hypothetical protein TPHA_0J01590 [Tetrapisispora phaffii CBS 4417]CCE64980.1 hypothetical protein TPHA_0J01590 [Tetrapisispora phaffii CBS 4417]